MKGAKLLTSQELTFASASQKMFLEGNMLDLTEHFQNKLDKKDIRLVYLGDHPF